ncbi:hypothetical protein GCM10022279_21020 [Comamonas faecalis]|uniref:AlpA family transcriptional regulator n=1 Tax=Comamonas faecalis TaxID=1387849 RepID=A0ABP7RGN8_9BURK
MFQTTRSPAMNTANSAPAVERSYRERLLRINDVCYLTGLGRSTVYAKVKGGVFPHPVQLLGACVAWRESEVDAWIAARPLATAPAPLKATRKGAAKTVAKWVA